MSKTKIFFRFTKSILPYQHFNNCNVSRCPTCEQRCQRFEVKCTIFTSRIVPQEDNLYQIHTKM